MHSATEDLTHRPDPGPRVSILIPAAGFGRRMGGRDKLLEEVTAGEPLLQRVVVRAKATGAPVLVGVKPQDTARRAVLDGLGVHIVTVDDAEDGMGASLNALAQAVSGKASGVMILPADMPDLETEDLLTLITRFEADGGKAPVQAMTSDGAPGHPVIFPASALPALRALSGDTGAKSILKGFGTSVIRHPLADQRALVDLDTPEAWTAWRLNSSADAPR